MTTDYTDYTDEEFDLNEMLYCRASCFVILPLLGLGIGSRGKLDDGLEARLPCQAGSLTSFHNS